MAARTRKTKDVEKATGVTPEAPKQASLRDENGLLKGVTHHYKPNGMIDWRKMISPEHVVVNKFALAGRGIDADSLPADALAKLVEESREEDLVIKLAGFREIATIRGFNRIESEIKGDHHEKAVVKVTIEWIPNFENPNSTWEPYTVSAIASASRESVDERFAKYLETLAENRAFVRAVRHSLGIVAVGQDEIKQEDQKAEVRNTKIHSLLNELMNKLGLDFEGLKVLTVDEGIPWNEKWATLEKIDPAVVMTIVPILKKLANS